MRIKMIDMFVNIPVTGFFVALNLNGLNFVTLVASPSPVIAQSAPDGPDLISITPNTNTLWIIGQVVTVTW